MSVNSGASSASSTSSARPLCYCGVPARVRYSWTDTNTARKWYGCENYKRTGDCDFFAWANNEMTTYETKIMERLKVLDDRRKTDSDRLEKLIETKDNDQYVKLEKLIEKKCNDQRVKLEKLIEKKYKDEYVKFEKLIERKYNDEYVRLRRELELCRTNRTMFSMFRAIIVVVILLLVFCFSGYGGSRGTYLMLN